MKRAMMVSKQRPGPADADLVPLTDVQNVGVPIEEAQDARGV